MHQGRFPYMHQEQRRLRVCQARAHETPQRGCIFFFLGAPVRWPGELSKLSVTHGQGRQSARQQAAARRAQVPGRKITEGQEIGLQ
jgi:hypothetical protein